MSLAISCRCPAGGLLVSRVELQAARILRLLDLQRRSLSVSLVGDEEIRSLNSSFRGQRRATDVLSFSLDEGQFGSLPHGMLGDVVISIETAARQARRAHRSLRSRVDRLLVHGILHLAGYDHEKSEEEAKRMRGKEVECGQALSRFDQR